MTTTTLAKEKAAAQTLTEAPSAIARRLAPEFARHAAEHDAGDIFVARNYDALKSVDRPGHADAVWRAPCIATGKMQARRVW